MLGVNNDFRQSLIGSRQHRGGCQVAHKGRDYSYTMTTFIAAGPIDSQKCTYPSWGTDFFLWVISPNRVS